MYSLSGKTVLVTGGARRLGRFLSLTAARAGANVIVHYNTSPEEAEDTAAEIRLVGPDAYTIKQDFQDTSALESICQRCWDLSPFDILVNNASIFADLPPEKTSLNDWETHIAVNLTAPFMISRDFMRMLPDDKYGRIINMLDWRSLRPGKDHFAYTIAKAGLAAMTQSLAVAGANRFSINGMAMGAILPPEAEGFDKKALLDAYPVKRWADLSEVAETFLFLASGPAYMTGDIIYLDGGRHLV